MVLIDEAGLSVCFTPKESLPLCPCDRSHKVADDLRWLWPPPPVYRTGTGINRLSSKINPSFLVTAAALNQKGIKDHCVFRENYLQQWFRWEWGRAACGGSVHSTFSPRSEQRCWPARTPTMRCWYQGGNVWHQQESVTKSENYIITASHPAKHLSIMWKLLTYTTANGPLRAGTWMPTMHLSATKRILTPEAVMKPLMKDSER